LRTGRGDCLSDFKSTGFKGVYIIRGKYRANIKHRGKNIILGYFDDIEDAKAARKEGEIKYRGKYASDNNITMFGVRYSYDESVEMKKLYDEGVKISEIAKKFNTYDGTIYKTLKRYGHKLKDRPDRHRKYILEENKFNCIDSHEKAYWLGFISADGSVSKRKGCNGSLIITLHRKDRSTLEKLSDFFETNKPIRDHTDKNYGGVYTEFSTFMVTSGIIYNDLVNLGVVERKTLVLKFPEKLDREFYNSYILGYFDGDGSVYSYKTTSEGRESIKNQVCILGTESLLLSFRNILNAELNLPMNKLMQKKGANVRHIKYGAKKDIYKIYKWFYQDIPHDLPLQRKKVIFEDICKEFIENK